MALLRNSKAKRGGEKAQEITMLQR